MVGDPSGRSEERNLLDPDTLGHNVLRISKQLERLLDFSPGPYSATLVNNADWTHSVGVLEFLRDVGKHITVNQMMAKESVKNRLSGEQGLSFTEFSYMLLQANDFRELCQHHDVELQMGGSDQWGNITTGIDLIRKTLSRPAFGLTWPLVTKSDGTKFGKTADGAVWLDPDRTSPYQFRQFWVQQSDADAIEFLRKFSLSELDVIEALIKTHQQAPEKRTAQRTLAQEMTALVHGPQSAHAVEAAADVLFGANPLGATAEVLAVVAAEVPSSQQSLTTIADPIAMLVACGLATSNADARRTISQGGVKVNGETISLETNVGNMTLIQGRWLLVKKGKTNYHLLEISS